MIKSNLGEVTIDGQNVVIKADLMVLFKVMLDSGALTDDEIMRCLEDSKMTEDEMMKKAWGNIDV